MNIFDFRKETQIKISSEKNAFRNSYNVWLLAQASLENKIAVCLFYDHANLHSRPKRQQPISFKQNRQFG